MKSFKKFVILSLLLFIAGIFTSACGSSGGGSSSTGIRFFSVANNNTETNTNNTNNNPTNNTPEPSIDNSENTHNSKKITFSKNQFSINIGETDNIIVYVDGEDKTSEVIFTLLKETTKKSTVATVDENGLITGLKQGTAIFKVSYKETDNDNYFTVIVNDPNLPNIELPNLELLNNEITIELGDKTKEIEPIVVTLNDKDVTSQAKFTSSDESIVTVDETGKITPLSEGTATIIVQVDGANDQVVTVNVILSEIQLKESEKTIKLGTTYNIVPKIHGQIRTQDATFTSNETAIATVDETGKITPVSEGTTTITIKIFGAKDTNFTVNVYNPYLHTIETNFESMTLYLGGRSKKITATVGGTSPTEATYESNNESVATVDSNGNVTPVSTGTAVITIKVPDTERDKIVTVTVSLPNLKVSTSNVTLGLLSSESVRVSTDNESNITSRAEYTSSDESIVTVENGNISSGMNTGTATITVHYDNTQEDKIVNVTVTDDTTHVTLSSTVLKQLGYTVESSGRNPTIYTLKKDGNIVTDLEVPSVYKYNGTTYRITGIYLYNFNSLTNVAIPDSVTSIGSSAFAGCSSLTDITIPESVKTIGSGAFYNCSSLTEITIPDSVTTLYGSYYYYYDEDEEYNPGYDYYYGQNAIFGNCTSLQNVTIGKGIKSIPDMFYNCSSLTEITIPDNVTSIGCNAFRNCYNLTTIILPNSINTIDDFAFCDCSSLSEITIPNSVKTLGYGVFYDCYSLTEITIPNSVTNIKKYHTNYDYNYSYSYPYYNALFGNCGSLQNVTIGTGLKTIPEFMFYNCSSLESLTIPNNITTIEEHAFYGCSGLTTINLSNNLKSIGFGAFSDCSSLTSIELPESLTNIDVKYHVLQGSMQVYMDSDEYDDYYNSNGTFSNCSSLTTIILPNWLTKIDNHEFSGCTNLTRITIPNSVTSIGSEAFKDCSSLTSINIPNGVTTIGRGAFSGCSSLTNITIPESVIRIGTHNSNHYNGYENVGTFYNCTSLSTVTINGNNLTLIGDYAFCDCSSLTSINIPNSVSTIGYEAFCNCSSLTTINIPNSITNIEFSTFYNCSSLTSLTIPQNVTSIGEGAFCDCSSLKNINIPNGITKIEQKTNKNCTSLTNITIPESVTIIGADNNTWEYGAFYNCTSLSTVTINGNNLTLIGASTFAGCTSLTSINIPNSVTHIGYRAFSYCSSLTNINIPNNVTSIESNTFSNCSSLTSINIPNNVTTIGSGAFYYCSSLTNITIPENATTIGSGAFQYCSSLTSINIPDSVTNIAGEAFSNCSSLEVTLPDNITVGNSAFGSVKNLTYNLDNYPTSKGWGAHGVTIKDGVTTIPSNAFKSCSYLTTINIPDSVTTIGEQAFYNCGYYSYTRHLTLTIPDSVTSIGSNALYNVKFYYYDNTALGYPWGGTKLTN